MMYVIKWLHPIIFSYIFICSVTIYREILSTVSTVIYHILKILIVAIK